MAAQRIAIIGAGPSGLRRAESLATEEDAFVDIYERRPAPFGLLAYGTCPRLRLLGNIEVGKDIAVEDLLDYYDTVIDTSGTCLAARGIHQDGTGIIALLQGRRIPFTTWQSPPAPDRTGRRPAEWADIVTRARCVPVCDQ